jgi:hypothetical protein
MCKNFDCLFVSYATVDSSHTSWIDIIRITDLEAAIWSGEPLVIRLVNLSSLKYSKAECTVVGKISESNSKVYTCDLIFGQNELNEKEDMELGTLSIDWDIPAPETGIASVIYKKPRRVHYKELGSSVGILPSFSYLEHMDNESEYFFYIDNKGKKTRREEIFYSEAFENNKLKLKPEDYERVYAYVKAEVDKLVEFSVGTRWPNPWPAELDPIYEAIQDEEQSGYFLSGLAQKAILESKYEWSTCKFRLYNRKKRTLYFYRTEKLKESE